MLRSQRVIFSLSLGEGRIYGGAVCGDGLQLQNFLVVAFLTLHAIMNPFIFISKVLSSMPLSWTNITGAMFKTTPIDLGRCRRCKSSILSGQNALTCVNYSYCYTASTKGLKSGLLPPCATTYHLECYSCDASLFNSVLSAPSFKFHGLRARLPDTRIRAFVCEVCYLRAAGVPERHPERRLLEALERKRNISCWNRTTDATLNGLQTGYNKLRRFEDRFHVTAIRRTAPLWPKHIDSIVSQWAVAFESTMMNPRTGKLLSLGSNNCIH